VRETHYSYDAARRLTSVGFDSDGDGTTDQTVSYQYEAGGLRTKLILPGNLAVSYRYDSLGRLVALDDWNTPTAQTTAYTYDSLGRLRLAERSTGLRSQYRYDLGGRLTTLHHSAGSRTLGHFAYTVDARGNRTQALEMVPHADTGSTTLDKDHLAVHYNRGTWADSGSFKQTTNFSAALSIGFAGDDITLTMGVGPDHSRYDLYLDASYYDTSMATLPAPTSKLLLSPCWMTGHTCWKSATATTNTAIPAATNCASSNW